MNSPPADTADSGIQWDKVYLKIPSTEIELNLMELIGIGVMLILTIILIWRMSSALPDQGAATEGFGASRTFKKKAAAPVYVVVQKGGQKKLMKKKMY